MNQRDKQEILKFRFIYVFSTVQPKISSFRFPSPELPSKTLSQTENDCLKLAEK